MSIISQQVTPENDGYRWAGEPSLTFSNDEYGGPSGARAAALAYAQHVVAQREASAGRKLTNYEHLHGIALKDRPDNRTIEQRADDERWQVPVTQKQGDKWDRFIDPPNPDTFQKPIGDLMKMTLQQRMAYFAKERQKVESEAAQEGAAMLKRVERDDVNKLLMEVLEFEESARFDGKVTQGELVAMKKATDTLYHVDGDLEAAKQYIAEAKAVRKARIQAEYDAEAATFTESQGKLATLRTQLTEGDE